MSQLDDIFKSTDIQSLKKFPGILAFETNFVEEYSYKSGLTPSKFLEHNGRRYFVKFPDDSIEIFNELFVAFLAKKIGLSCIDAKLLFDPQSNQIGVISEDFGEHFTYGEFGGTVLWDKESRTVSEIVDKVITSIRTLGVHSRTFNGIVIDRNYLIEKLNSYSCFDYLVDQGDRHKYNIAFIISNRDGKRVLDVAPLYDNASAFNTTFKYYHLNPNDCRVYGLEQQRLLNNDYSDMLASFTYVSEHFEEVIQQFDSIYGISKFITPIEFEGIKQRIFGKISAKIKFCDKEHIAPFVPLPITYAILKKHYNELIQNPSTFNSLVVFPILHYYSNDSWENYNNYIAGKSGEFPQWKFYNECLEQVESNQLDPSILEGINNYYTVRRQIIRTALLYTTQYLTVNLTEQELLFAMFFNDLHIFENVRKIGKSNRIPTVQTIIKQNLSYVQELIEWQKMAEQQTQTKAILEELSETKKVLRKYSNFVNRQIKLCKIDPNVFTEDSEANNGH